MELHQAMDQGVAFMIEQVGAVTGYKEGIRILYHAVARSDECLNTDW